MLRLVLSGDRGSYDIYDDDQLLLANCSANVHLAAGIHLSLATMPTTHEQFNDSLTFKAGGDQSIPELKLSVKIVQTGCVKVDFKITNTTRRPIAIDWINSLVSRKGYRKIEFDELKVRRTGWQSFSPASPETDANIHDPWLQPPVQAPMLLDRVSHRQDLPWMTVLKQDSRASKLLIGFSQASNYLGVVHVAPSEGGHYLKATNHLDGIELAAGDAIDTESLVLIYGNDENKLLDNYADMVAKNMEARTPEPPTGWCSWYYYFDKVTENDVLDNLKVIESKNLPLDYVQIDDGYQTLFGDWLETNSKFPRGLKYLADKIKATGRQPGIWLAPFMADQRSDLYQRHPDWFIRDNRNRPIDVNRLGDPYWTAPNYGLDITNPKVQAWLREIIQTIVHDWGYRYLKIDFLYAAAVHGQRHDPDVTGVQAYRKGLSIIREIAGDDVFILACGAPLLCSVGLVDGMRISSDIAADVSPRASADVTRPWSRDPVSSFVSHAWMHDKLWVNDPDCIRVRRHNIQTSSSETRSLVSLAALGGGSMISGDNLRSLEPEGFDLLSRLLPLTKNQLEVVESMNGRPIKLKTAIHRGDTDWTIIAQYNWTLNDECMVFNPYDWQLQAGEYHIYDLLEQRYIGCATTIDNLSIDPKGAKVLLVTFASSKQPQVVTTSRHIFGPAGDIVNVQSAADKLTIELNPLALSKTTVLVSLPTDYKSVHIENGHEVGRLSGLIEIKPDSQSCSIAYLE